MILHAGVGFAIAYYCVFYSIVTIRILDLYFLVSVVQNDIFILTLVSFFLYTLTQISLTFRNNQTLRLHLSMLLLTFKYKATFVLLGIDTSGLFSKINNLKVFSVQI